MLLNGTYGSVLYFLFCLLLFWQWRFMKKKKNYRKEGSDETGVCALPPSPLA